MDALKDKEMTKEVLKGFYMFLYAEKVRHQGDIDMIVRKLNRVEHSIGLSESEIQRLKDEANRYVEF